MSLKIKLAVVLRVIARRLDPAHPELVKQPDSNRYRIELLGVPLCEIQLGPVHVHDVRNNRVYRAGY